MSLTNRSIQGIRDMLSVCSWEHWVTIQAFYGAEEQCMPGIEDELADAEAEIAQRRLRLLQTNQAVHASN